MHYVYYLLQTPLVLLHLIYEARMTDEGFIWLGDLPKQSALIDYNKE